VHVVDVPNAFNSMVFATAQPTDPENLRANLQNLSHEASTHPLLLDVLQRAIDNLQPTPQSEVVFTDDWAPVEMLVNSIVIRFMLGGELETLPVIGGQQ
jgi:hypothetical protein